MAAQKGAALLLKINTTGSTYVTVGGLRSTSITLNDEAVDVTNKDSSGNRTCWLMVVFILCLFQAQESLLIPLLKLP